MDPSHKNLTIMTLADLLRAPPDRALGRQAELARGLYCAVFVGELDRIEPLLALGADPFAIPEGSSRCALSVAACSTAWTLPPLAMFQAILAAGLPRTPEIGPTGETPLMFAARSSDQEALFRVQLLLPHSEVDAVAADGFSALMGACEAHNLEICSLLAPLSNLSLLADDGRDIFTIVDQAAHHYSPAKTAAVHEIIRSEMERRLLSTSISPDDIANIGRRGQGPRL